MNLCTMLKKNAKADDGSFKLIKDRAIEEINGVGGVVSFVLCSIIPFATVENSKVVIPRDRVIKESETFNTMESVLRAKKCFDFLAISKTCVLK